MVLVLFFFILILSFFSFFSSLMAIKGGLSSAPISRMKRVLILFFSFYLFLFFFLPTTKQTWDALEGEPAAIYQKIENLMSHSLNFSNYRTHLKVLLFCPRPFFFFLFLIFFFLYLLLLLLLFRTSVQSLASHTLDFFYLI